MHYICITLWSDIESYFYFFPLVCRTLGGSRDACCFILWADGVQDCRLYISSLPTTPDFLLSSNNRQQQLPSERPERIFRVQNWRQSLPIVNLRCRRPVGGGRTAESVTMCWFAQFISSGAMFRLLLSSTPPSCLPIPLIIPPARQPWFSS